MIGLALGGGGYEVTPRHVAGLVVWLLIVILVALGAAARATTAKPFFWAGGLILALAILSALSSAWSGSVEVSVTEADRVMVYLGVFTASFLIAQTDQTRQRFGEGIALGLLGIALLALSSRLLPHLITVSDGLGSGPRTRYPLGYWNANGVACGLGFALALWMSRRTLTAALRWIAVGGMPVFLVALYLTYSRGGLLALLIASAILVALSHDRFWLLCTLAIGAIGAIPAVLAIQARDALANNLPQPGVIDQGAAVGFYVLGGIALSLALFWGLRRLESRGGSLTRGAVALSRNRRVLTGLAGLAAVAGIAAALVVGGHAWNQFSSAELDFPENAAGHFSSLSGGGRNEFYKVAIEAFEEDPVAGHGAGTYQFSWDLLRHVQTPIRDAHSLYLEAFAELGVIGGVLVLAMVIALLAIGFLAWRDASGTRRELHAALLAVSIAFAVAAGIDWFWEIAGLGVVFFLASGVLVAARCRQLTAEQPAAAEAAPRRSWLAIGTLAVAWIAALALIGPLLVDREIQASKSAAAESNFAAAEDHAETAHTIEPWAASPYVQLGLLAQSQGILPLASERLGEAIDREKDNWILYYLRARVEHEAGNAAAAEKDLDRAQQLNPLETCLSEGWNAC